MTLVHNPSRPHDLNPLGHVDQIRLGRIDDLEPALLVSDLDLLDPEAVAGAAAEEGDGLANEGVGHGLGHAQLLGRGHLRKLSV